MSEEHYEEEFDLEGPINIDLGGVRVEPVAQGWHYGVIEMATLRLSSQRNIPQLGIGCRVDDEDDPEHGRMVFWNLNLRGDGAIFTVKCLTALGIGTALSYPDKESLEEEFLGRAVEFYVRHRVNKETGDLQEQIGRWRSPSEFSEDPLGMEEDD